MPAIVTGKFTAVNMDTSTPRTIDTGMTHIRALTIVNPITAAGDFGGVVYTTDQLQADTPGAFLYDGAHQVLGLTIVGGMFTLNHKAFQRTGQTYYWEARGD
ncbi:MAG: hypothetical protein JXB32_10190 [Deltaproteobacteria bacterium]|nr:hypothetical protein [Deltaproteobacteria bacterium]